MPSAWQHDHLPSHRSRLRQRRPERVGRLQPLQEEEFCHEFHLVDLRVYDNCKKVCDGCEHVFNLAADMGGMGFIQSNHSVIMYNNTVRGAGRGESRDLRKTRGRAVGWQ